MEIKKNIRVGDRIRFVDFVCDMCEKDGKQYYALFDYAWRIAVITFFAPKAELDKMDTDEMCDFVYRALRLWKTRILRWLQRDFMRHVKPR